MATNLKEGVQEPEQLQEQIEKPQLGWGRKGERRAGGAPGESRWTNRMWAARRARLCLEWLVRNADGSGGRL